MNVDSIMLNALISEKYLQRNGQLGESPEMDPLNLLDMRLQARLFFIVFY